MEDKKITVAKAFRFLSPLVIVSLYPIYGIISSILEFSKSSGWGEIGLIIFLPAFIVLISVDFLIKFFVQENTALLWVIEMIMVLIGGVIYYNRFL